MKLLIKIFSQTTCIILLVSSGIFLYTTYCWKNQSIQNINSYESSIFRTNILQFENKTSLSDNQKQNADNEMRPQIVTYAFRQVFHDSAVLYLDGKMTYNGTVYEFDVKKLRELCASKANMVDHGSNSDGHGPMISQINGRTLLLFYYGNVNMGCGTFISILEGSLKSQAVSFAIPVAAVLPWSDSVLQEYKSGFLKEILPRTTRRQYIEGKVFSIMVSGFMVWTLSILTVLFINFIVFYPLEIKGAIQKEALLDLLMKAFRTGLIGSIISIFGGSCGILWDSAYMAYGIPFVSFYFGIILHDRYFKNQIWFYPVEWILADENWGPDKIGLWLFLLLFLLVMLGILGGVLYGRLEEI